MISRWRGRCLATTMALPTPPGDLLDSSTMLSNLNELSKRGASLRRYSSSDGADTSLGAATELLRALLSELPQADLLETQTLIHGLLSRDFISVRRPLPSSRRPSPR